MAYTGEQNWGEAERTDGADSGTELLLKADQLGGPGGRLTLRRAGIAGLLFAGLACAAVISFEASPNGGEPPSRGMAAVADFDEAEELMAWNPNGTYGKKKMRLHKYLEEKCTSLGGELFGYICYKKCTDLTGGVFPVRSTAITCCKEQPCGFTNSMLDTGFKEQVHMHKCKEGEEMFGKSSATFGSVCYKTCASLTQDKFPYRVGATTCCSSSHKIPCLWAGNLKTDVGFSIGAGDSCKSDEEMFQKVCFKKCGLLTNNTYPYRTARASCCKTTGWKCISPFLSKTDAKFDVSGGKDGMCKPGYEFFAHLCFQTCSSLTQGKFPNRKSPTACCRTNGLKCLLPKYLKVQTNFSNGNYPLQGGNGSIASSGPEAAVFVTDKNSTKPSKTNGPMDRFR